MEIHYYNEGGLRYGVGPVINVTNIPEGGPLGGTPLGEHCNTISNGVYNEDKNGFALLDYAHDVVTGTSTLTFACAIKRDNSAIPLVDKKYIGLDIYEVKYNADSNGVVTGGT